MSNEIGVFLVISSGILVISHDIVMGMGKKMPLQRAKDISKTFIETGYNQKETLLKMGYSPKTARSASGNVVNNAFKRIVDEDKEALLASTDLKSTILSIVGFTQADIVNEYSFIIKQNKDLTTKLKALMPLLKELGVTWDDKAMIVNPTLNLTVKENDNARLNQATELPFIDNGMSQNVDCATLEDTAQLGHIQENDDISIDNDIDMLQNEAGGFDSSPQERKEGESHSPNIAKKSSIDNEPKILQSTEAPPEKIL